MQEIELPDGTVLEFPDGMSDDEIRAAVQKFTGGPQPATQPAAVANFLANMQQPSAITHATNGLPAPPPISKAQVLQHGGEIGPGATAAATGLQGLTFGGGDELVGAMSALPAMFTDESMGDAYRRGRDGQRAAIDAGREQNPGTALVGEMAGAVASPLSALGLPAIAKATTLAGRAGTGGLLGALGGGTYGALDSEGGAENRLEGAKDNTLLAGLTGAALPVLGQAVRAGPGKWLAQRKANKAFAKNAPGLDKLRAEEDALFAIAEKSGVVMPGKRVTGLADEIVDYLKTEGLVAGNGAIDDAYPKAKAALARIMDNADVPMSPLQIKNARMALAEAARAPGNEGRIGRAILAKFDDAAGKTSDLLRDANAVSARRFRLEDNLGIDDAALDAVGANYTQAQYDTAIRQKYRALLKRIREGKAQGYSPDEIAAMEKVVRGGRVENSLRYAGKIAPAHLAFAGGSYGPTGALLAMQGAPVPAVLGGGAALYGAGRGAARGASRLQAGNADLLRAMVASRAVPPQIAARTQPGLLEMLMPLGAIPGQQ